MMALTKQDTAPPPVFEDDIVTLQQADFCAVPGYLVLRLKNGAESMADLAPAEARHVGLMLSRTARVLEEAAGAERVYILSFAEIDRRLHFHLFPRTARILDAFCEATGGDPASVNGPMLFEWARTAWPAGRAPEPGDPDTAAILDDLRRRLAE